MLNNNYAKRITRSTIDAAFSDKTLKTALGYYGGSALLPMAIAFFGNRCGVDVSEYEWETFRLGNGGVYIKPEDLGELLVSIPKTGTKVTLNADSAGIVACLYALCYLMEKQIDGEQMMHESMYWRLRAYADAHPDCSEINQALQ